VVVKRDSGIPRLALAFHCPSAVHRDSAPLEVLATLLGAGRSSRLYQLLVANDGGGADEVSVGHLLQPDPGLFTISVELSENCDARLTEGLVLDALRDVAHDPPSLEEIAKARRLWMLDHVLAAETSLGLAGRMGFWEMLGGLELGERFVEDVGAVAPDDVSRVAATYLDPETRNSAWLSIES
jgi:zinc protease